MSALQVRGVVMMLLANLAFCSMACMVRALSGMNSWTTTLFRFLLGMGIISLFAMSGKIRLNFVNSRGLFFRGVLGGCSTAIFFYSITKIGLVRAGFIASLYPAFAAIFSHYFLKERLTIIKWTALAGALAGVTFLMLGGAESGGSGANVSRYDLFALLGSMLAGMTIVSIKRLQGTDSTVAIFFAQSLVGACIVFIPASISPVTISPAALAGLLAIGVLATVGQLLMTDSYRYISVSTGALLVMTAPVFNCIAGLFFFHEPFSVQAGIGALVILGSSTGLLLEKR